MGDWSGGLYWHVVAISLVATTHDRIGSVAMGRFWSPLCPLPNFIPILIGLPVRISIDEIVVIQWLRLKKEALGLSYTPILPS
jgi:hypothetical protein